MQCKWTLIRRYQLKIELSGGRFEHFQGRISKIGQLFFEETYGLTEVDVEQTRLSGRRVNYRCYVYNKILTMSSRHARVKG